MADQAEPKIEDMTGDEEERVQMPYKFKYVCIPSDIEQPIKARVPVSNIV